MKREARIEYWLHLKSELEKYLLEDITVLIKDGIKLTAMREVGSRVRRIHCEEFHSPWIHNREIIELLEKVGKVISPVTCVLDSTMKVFTGERVVDVELSPGK